MKHFGHRSLGSGLFATGRKIVSGPVIEDSNSLEDRVVRLARTGRLAKAARHAVHMQQKKGLAITCKRGDQIVKRYADGREEILGTVERRPYTLPRGVTIIR
jgi:hypothetical protein